VLNLIEHGSPLWPFVSTPWGDPVPGEINLVSHTMLERLQATLFDHLRAYVSGISGSPVLIVAGILVLPLTMRRRPSLPAAAGS